MKNEKKTPKLSVFAKIKTYYSYNKYKMPVLFALLGTICLTAFPGQHYAHWYEIKAGVGDYNALAVFLLMLLSLIQFVNVINISGKKSRKSELTYTIIFTVINVIMLIFAYVYIAPYFKNGFKPDYISAILVIALGMVFMIIANVFAFLYLGYDTKASVKEILASLENDEDATLFVTDDE